MATILYINKHTHSRCRKKDVENFLQKLKKNEKILKKFRGVVESCEGNHFRELLFKKTVLLFFITLKH
jgi:hypothetical protein